MTEQEWQRALVEVLPFHLALRVATDKANEYPRWVPLDVLRAEQAAEDALRVARISRGLPSPRPRAFTKSVTSVTSVTPQVEALFER